MSQQLERFLVVAFKYPPYAAVGGKRWAKLSKYLARQGVEVHVITVPWGPETPDAMRDVDSDAIHIHRIPALVPTRIRVTSPAPHTFAQRARNRLCRTQFYRTRVANRYWARDAALWGPALIPTLAWLTRTTRAQAVVATGGPFWAGYWVASARRLLPRVPLIHEFRDPWFDLPDESMPSQGGRERVRRAEQKLIDSADAIVTVTEGLSDLTRPKAGSTPIFTVTNGFDPEDLPQRPSARPRPFRLIHGGNLFVGRDEPLRAFLSAVAQVADEIPELELVFRGGFPAAVRAEYSNLEELGVLRVMPPIPGPAFMEELDNSFAALQFNSRQFPYALSTKIFEYGASRRPVLSLNYGGDIARLVLEHGLGWSIDASSPATVSDGLRAAHAEWRHNPGLCTSPTGFESYDYARIAADYRSRIESLL